MKHFALALIVIALLVGDFWSTAAGMPAHHDWQICSSLGLVYAGWYWWVTRD